LKPDNYLYKRSVFLYKLNSQVNDDFQAVLKGPGASCRPALPLGPEDRGLSGWNDPVDVAHHATSNRDRFAGVSLGHLPQSI